MALRIKNGLPKINISSPLLNTRIRHLTISNITKNDPLRHQHESDFAYKKRIAKEQRQMEMAFQMYHNNPNTRAAALNHLDDKYKSEEYLHFRDQVLYFYCGIVVLMAAVALYSVPMYRIFCSKNTGIFGTKDPRIGKFTDKIEEMNTVKNRQIKVNFMSEGGSRMQWNFKPQQNQVTTCPGETSLVFYTAKNDSDDQIVGVSTYWIEPPEAAAYFNKIQCFCFDQQILDPHEEVDLPVFFFIDPDFDVDPYLIDIDEISLTYTFFKVNPDSVDLPGFQKN